MAQGVRMTTAWFEEQMQWLHAHEFNTISSAELAGFVAGTQTLPARSVAVTFDVGGSHFDDYAQVVVPTLRRYGMQAIFFVMPYQTHETCDGRLACWPDLLAWRDEGLISIESHSLTHYDYATLPLDALIFDVTRSKSEIEAHTGQPVLGLCYPFDSVAPAAFDALREAGYQFAVAGATRYDRSVSTAELNPFSLPRYYPYSGEEFYPLISGTGGQTFAEMLLGAVADEAP
jgi:peptidoglycan/xylan/chitin deacetylase (PgdA/CDA1 family)